MVSSYVVWGCSSFVLQDIYEDKCNATNVRMKWLGGWDSVGILIGPFGPHSR